MDDRDLLVDAIFGIPDVGDRSREIADQLRGIVAKAEADPQIEIRVEKWATTPERGPGQRVLLTSVGLLGLTRSSLTGFSKVINEVAAVFGETADADELTIKVGSKTFPLASVTDEMIESWLPQPAP